MEVTGSEVELKTMHWEFGSVKTNCRQRGSRLQTVAQSKTFKAETVLIGEISGPAFAPGEMAALDMEVPTWNRTSAFRGPAVANQ